MATLLDKKRSATSNVQSPDETTLDHLLSRITALAPMVARLARDIEQDRRLPAERPGGSHGRWQVGRVRKMTDPTSWANDPQMGDDFEPCRFAVGASEVPRRVGALGGDGDGGRFVLGVRARRQMRARTRANAAIDANLLNVSLVHPLVLGRFAC